MEAIKGGIIDSSFASIQCMNLSSFYLWGWSWKRDF